MPSHPQYFWGFAVGTIGLVGIRVNLNLTLARQFVDELSQMVVNHALVALLIVRAD
jgi:hypothetical protein